MSSAISKLIFPLSMFILAACNQPAGYSSSSQDGLTAFSKDSLVEHIRVLSSDSFQGRRPFSLGEKRTVDYLSRAFAQAGLEPGNGNSFFQDVPMVEITPDCDPLMNIHSAKKSFSLKKMDDYVIWTENTDSVVSLKNDSVVFAGFGVVAPEYNWNDYAGLDVRGKIVLVMVNDPGFGTADTTMFKGKAMTYYGRWTYKFEEAARQGAKACLIIHNTAAASYPFSVIQNSWGTAQLHLDRRNNREYRCPVEGWITGESANKLLMAAGGDSSWLVKANQKGFHGVPLGITIATSMKVKSVFNTSKNVIGKITGSKRPGEYIIYTAHWDHFGIGKPDAKGDSIYNGALDNASGTASLLEMARAFKSMAVAPERTILFLAVTAEEQGLLGSKYYAEHPLYPVEKTAANINIDEINNTGKTKDMTITGEGQSDLEDYLRNEVTAHGRYIAKDAHPEAGHYFRSDHFSFAKVGVPSLTAGAGVDNLEKGIAYGKQKEDEYNDKRYHQPGDEYDAATWNLDGGMEDIQLLFLVGKKLAFETTWPQWKPGSEFKALRKQLP